MVWLREIDRERTLASCHIRIRDLFLVIKWCRVYLDDTRDELMEETLTELLEKKQLIDLLSAVDGHNIKICSQ